MSEWVSVKERLPDIREGQAISEIVFGYTDRRMIGLYRYWKRYWHFRELVPIPGWDDNPHVTHWMPLPAPPEEK